ncbi:MAG: hypothetical protein HYY52_05220 [Candidatus Melainabacteria bacterium]|nr:hypothetical protein [Candidatus Melainabacteria bacterium]
MKKYFKTLFLIFFILIFVACPAISASQDVSYKAATSTTVVNYARNLLLSIVDSNFRGSWVVDPENWDKEIKVREKVQKPFESLAKIKIGNTPREVKQRLSNPTEIKNKGKIWVYGKKLEDGTYLEPLEVFFDDKVEHVIGITSFNPKSIVENIGVNIGDPIDKVLSLYGEPVDEKDFIEDPDNKQYLGLYYLYPRSGIGFLIGQDKTKKNLLVQGVLVFGKF